MSNSDAVDPPRLCLQHTTFIKERAGERGFHLVLLNHLLEKGDMLRFDLAFRLKRLG